jgi:hypothetical protein
MKSCEWEDSRSAGLTAYRRPPAKRQEDGDYSGAGKNFWGLFSTLSIMVALVSTFALDVIAALIVGERAVLPGLSRWLLMQTAPVGLIGILSWDLARLGGLRHGLALFVVSVIPLLGLYFIGHHNSYVALAEHRWTASALNAGLLPFKAIPILLFSSAAWVIYRLKQWRI